MAINTSLRLALFLIASVVLGTALRGCSGEKTAACAAECAGRICGTDDCGGLCGTCPGGQTCNASGQCLACSQPARGSTVGPDPGLCSTTTAPFRFITWADTRSGSDTGVARLQTLSQQAARLNPPANFTLNMGDIENVGFALDACAAAWRDALNGGSTNRTFDTTFVARGNHDISVVSSRENWQSFFDIAGVASAVGATSLSSNTVDIEYSFDFHNSHFVAMDFPGDLTDTQTAAQRTWLDDDLRAAESRGLTHAFLFWHGPLWSVTAGHAIDPSDANVQALVAVLNKHLIVSAIFVGHEHLVAWTHLTSARIPGLTNTIEQFHSGAAGAPWYDSIVGRTDASMEQADGFTVIDVDGRTFTVTWYQSGNATSRWTRTFTK